MARLSGRLVGLDGVPAQQDNYRRSGFELAYRNVRYGGTAPAGRTDGLVDARTVPVRAAARIRRPAVPGAEARLPGRVDQPAGEPWARRRGGRRAARLRGAPAVPERPQDRPALRREPRDRERLFDGLCEGIAGEPVFLDVPEPNVEAVALAEGRDLEPAFETARMYTGPAPAIDLTQLYGVTTFELG